MQIFMCLNLGSCWKEDHYETTETNVTNHHLDLRVFLSLILVILLLCFCHFSGDGHLVWTVSYYCFGFWYTSKEWQPGHVLTNSFSSSLIPADLVSCGYGTFTAANYNIQQANGCMARDPRKADHGSYD